MSSVPLAIVVPYYKVRYLDDLLDALVGQSDGRFNLYIGDDCSPSAPDRIINKYKDRLDIRYKRFEKRLGHISLVAQWNRCVNLIDNESWIWVLPDDDLPADNCVAEFYNALNFAEINSVNVLRFPLDVVDSNGLLIKRASPSPDIENNYDFYSRLLRGKNESSLGDNIFRRSALESAGGFVDFPKGWGSDHATVLKAASGGLICCLQNASFRFRMSGENISSDKTDGAEKMAARVLFARWLKANEDIFPQKPDLEFYCRFYWKGEYYALHEWNLSLKLFEQLLLLRHICTSSLNPLPLVKLFIRKILLQRGVQS